MSLLSQERIDSSLKLLRELNLKDLLSTPSPTLSQDANQANNSSGQSTSKDKMIESDGREVKPLKVSLRGLESMHTPSKTSVL
jgi:activating signal cointegrator complex subunit 1